MDAGTLRFALICVGFWCVTVTMASPSSNKMETGHQATQECGQVNQPTVIVGGIATGVRQYPWQVYFVSQNSRFICGGSIISNRWIMTAAHCTKGTPDSGLRVLVGNIDNSTVAITDAVLYHSTKIIEHPDYNTTTEDNNIALIELNTPIDFTKDNIQPVCLPIADKLYEEVDAIIVGLVAESEGLSVSSQLYKVTVSTMKNSECNHAHDVIITDNMICAEYKEGGQESCQGNLGGPLISTFNEGETHAEQIGITFIGGCPRPGNPRVYTRVGKYLDWIKTVTDDPTFHVSP